MTGLWSCGGLARATRDSSAAGLSYWAVRWAPKANLEKFSPEAGPVPSSRRSSTTVASPAELCSGSGSSTCTPAADGGPPADGGSRKFQPVELPSGCRRDAADRGITIISGDRATSIPVVWTRCAPAGPLRATPTHRLESGIHASMAGRPRGGVLPSTIAAAMAG